MRSDKVGLLAEKARDRLREAGLDDPTIERLADRYIAEDRGEDLDAFVEWARADGVPSDTVDEASDQSFPASDPPSSWASAGESGQPSGGVRNGEVDGSDGMAAGSS